MYVLGKSALSFAILFSFLSIGCTLDVSFYSLESSIAPTTLDYSPRILSAAGGETLQVTGSNFQNGDQIYLDGIACPSTQFVSESSLTCVVPAQSQVTAVNVTASRMGATEDISGKLLVTMSVGGSGDNGTEMFKKNLGTNYGVKQIAGKIYFNNSPNYKINILNSYPTQSYPEFDSCLGQEFTDKISMLGYGFNKYYSFSAYDFDSDGTRLVVADATQRRILIWNSIPTSPTQSANVVLGHADWLGQAINDGGTPTASSLNSMRGIRIKGGKIFVADTDNNRVLIWNSIPTVNNTPADVVLGQPDFTSNTANNGGVSATSLSKPYHIEIVGTRLIVADTGNNRVLIWNTIPTASTTAADIVLGQATFTTNTANLGGSVSAQTLRGPGGVYSDGTRLFVADSSNHRVLTWDAIPTGNQTAADHVLGQAGFTSATSGITSSAISSPMRVVIIDNNLVVSDTGNNRTLFYTGVPTSNTAATYVVGQPSFTDNIARNPNKPLGMVNVTGVTTDGTRLVAVDTGKHRVLIWNTLPTSIDQTPDVILGQNDINAYTKATSTTAKSLSGPRGALIIGNKLYVTDAANNRILLWNTWPTTNNQTADAVLGQSTVSATSANAGNASPTASTFSTPYGMSSDGTNLIVSDWGNSRVMIWNSAPTANGQAADVILGQANATTTGTNTGGLSAATMYNPYSARVFNGKLYVADKGNQRLLIFNSVPTVTGTSADVVLGQADMTTNDLNRGTGAISALTLTAPMDMYVENNKLYVLEDVANRISIFNSVPTTNGVAADSAVGISSLTSYAPAQPKGLGWPNSMAVADHKIYVADYINGRILILPFDQ